MCPKCPGDCRQGRLCPSGETQPVFNQMVVGIAIVLLVLLAVNTITVLSLLGRAP